MIDAIRRSRQPLALLVALFALAGCERTEPSPSATQSASAPQWEAFVDQFIEDYFVAHPSFAVNAGRHEFDGQLPDFSAAGINSEVARLEQERSAASAYTDEALSPAQRFQREYLLSVIDRDLFWSRDAGQPFTNPSYYFDAGLDPSTYVTVPYAPLEQRLRAFIQYAEGIPAALTQIRANLRLPLPKSFVDYGVAGFSGFAEFYREDVPQAFAEVSDPQLQEQLRTAIEPAAQAMQETADWLRAQPASDTGYALGAERFADMLRMTERVDTPLDELEAIGHADLQRNLTALTQACKEWAPGDSVKACVARAAADKPQGGAVAGARSQLAQLRQFIIDHHIVTVPGAEEALVEEAPAYRRQNSAYINIPGPYEKGLPSVYYIAPPDPAWTKAEQLAYIPGEADLLFTSVHEVWPGHFLQFLHSNRSDWRFGQLFVGYAFAEGWAHYSEELMVEEGLADGQPELHVGQLLNALLRNVRFLCAIGLHTEGMSVGRCEQMFKEQAFQDPGNARQQAARGTYDPAYLNYTMGKLMIRKLRSDWQAEHPNESLQGFHDQFLSSGGPPIPLVRGQMLSGPLDDLF